MSVSTDHVKNLIDAVLAGDYTQADESFNNAFNVKAAERLELVKREVAQKRFGSKKD